MTQLSMFDLMEPKPVEARWTPPPMREFPTRAYGTDYAMEIRVDEPDPIEIEVRGTPTLIRWGFGWQTYTVEPVGSAYWSETGFRSFGYSHAEPDEIRAVIESYIDSKDGCKGKLTRWWPFYALQWRQAKDFASRYDRSEIWAQWGPERHAECWAAHDARQQEAVDRMCAEGIDPEEVWKSR